MLALNWRSQAFTLLMLFTMEGMAIFLSRCAPHAGHTSLMTIIAIGLLDVRVVFGQQEHGIIEPAFPV